MLMFEISTLATIGQYTLLLASISMCMSVCMYVHYILRIFIPLLWVMMLAGISLDIPFV